MSSANTQNAPSPAQYVETPFTFEQTIPDYRTFYLKGDEIFSEEQRIRHSDIAFKMSLMLRDRSKLEIKLILINPKPTSDIIMKNYAVEIEKEDGQVYERREFKSAIAFTTTEMVLKNILNVRNPTGTPIHTGRIAQGRLTFRISGHFVHPDIPARSKTLLKDVECLFNDKESSDITFVVENKTFYAHRIVLAAQSPVFKEMFYSGMSEDSENTITDVDPNLFEIFLRFFYTGDVPGLAGVMNDLLLLADRYNVDSLKDACEFEMVSLINIENCIEYYFISERLHCTMLYDQTLKFMAKNVLAVRWGTISRDDVVRISAAIKNSVA